MARNKRQEAQPRIVCPGECRAVTSRTVATGHIWLLSTQNEAGITEGLELPSYLLLVHLNFTSHVWLVAIALNSMGLDVSGFGQELTEKGFLERKEERMEEKNVNYFGSSCLSFPVGMTGVSNGRDQQARGAEWNRKYHVMLNSLFQFNALYPCTSRPVMLEPGPALGMGSSIVGSLSKMFDLLTFAPFLNF